MSSSRPFLEIVRKSTSIKAIDDVAYLTADIYDSSNPKNKADQVQELAKIMLHQVSIFSPLSQVQLEAIAYLTGYIHPDLEKNNLQNKYKQHNFINDEAKLLLPNFEKGKLALQLVARIIQPDLIAQSDLTLCGPENFMKAIIKTNPLVYSEFVCRLMTTGEATLKLSADAPGLHTKLDPSLLQRKSSAQLVAAASQDPKFKLNKLDIKPFLADCDYILAVFRQSHNRVFSFIGERHPLTSQTVLSDSVLRHLTFGATLPNEYMEWLDKVGYKNTQKFNLNSADDINRLGKLFEHRGYQCAYHTNGKMAIRMIREVLVNNKNNTDQANSNVSSVGKIIELLISQHYITINRISCSNGKVTIGFNTAGYKIDEYTLPLSLFQQDSGFSNALVGESPDVVRLRNERIKVIIENPNTQISPYKFFHLVDHVFFKGTAIQGTTNSDNTIPVVLIDLYKKVSAQLRCESKLDDHAAAKSIQDEISRVLDQLIPDRNQKLQPLIDKCLTCFATTPFTDESLWKSVQVLKNQVEKSQSFFIAQHELSGKVDEAINKQDINLLTDITKFCVAHDPKINEVLIELLVKVKSSMPAWAATLISSVIPPDLQARLIEMNQGSHKKVYAALMTVTNTVSEMLNQWVGYLSLHQNNKLYSEIHENLKMIASIFQQQLTFLDTEIARAMDDKNTPILDTIELNNLLRMFLVTVCATAEACIDSISYVADIKTDTKDKCIEHQNHLRATFVSALDVVAAGHKVNMQNNKPMWQSLMDFQNATQLLLNQAAETIKLKTAAKFPKSDHHILFKSGSGAAAEQQQDQKQDQKQEVIMQKSTGPQR